MNTADVDLVPLDPARPLLSVESNRSLLRQLLGLALPTMAEQLLNMFVGLTDTWVANHLPTNAPAAAAAVGTMAYILWFMGLLGGTIGTGATALIARARGARHRSLANKVCGQSISTAIVVGIVIGLVGNFGAESVIGLCNLNPDARPFALIYIRTVSYSIPFAMVLFVANSCLRGAGDTITPARTMIAVSILNVVACVGLTYGRFGLPAMGFRGMALGTMIAYMFGGTVQLAILLRGRGGLQLYPHRLPPHWHTLKRVLRIGIPAGFESAIMWVANFGIVFIINGLDAGNISSAAHLSAIRIEAISYLGGFAVAMAAATMVGQSLGMKQPQRARRSAYLAYIVGGGFMGLCGVLLVLFARVPAAQIANHDPAITSLTVKCLRIAGCVQVGFAAASIFGGALRGAGDTMAVMLLSMASIVFVRFAGVLIVTQVFHLGLVAIWMVLCGELMVRGAVIFLRFLHGGWMLVKV